MSLASIVSALIVLALIALVFLFSINREAKPTYFGYEQKSREFKVLQAMMMKVIWGIKGAPKDVVITKNGFRLHESEGNKRLVVGFRSINSAMIAPAAFRMLAAIVMRNLAEVLREKDLEDTLISNGSKAFPTLLAITHECTFLAPYGEKSVEIDAVASITFQELQKIQPAFNEALVDKVATLEISDTPIDLNFLLSRSVFVPGVKINRTGGIRRSPISSDVRDGLLSDSQYACQQCGARQQDGATMEVDHIIPLSAGGTNERSNLQILCATCNRKKGNRM